MSAPHVGLFAPTVLYGEHVDETLHAVLQSAVVFPGRPSDEQWAGQLVYWRRRYSQERGVTTELRSVVTRQVCAVARFHAVRAL